MVSFPLLFKSYSLLMSHICKSENVPQAPKTCLSLVFSSVWLIFWKIVFQFEFVWPAGKILSLRNIYFIISWLLLFERVRNPPKYFCCYYYIYFTYSLSAILEWVIKWISDVHKQQKGHKIDRNAIDKDISMKITLKNCKILPTRLTDY